MLFIFFEQYDPESRHKLHVMRSAVKPSSRYCAMADAVFYKFFL